MNSVIAHAAVATEPLTNEFGLVIRPSGDVDPRDLPRDEIIEACKTAGVVYFQGFGASMELFEAVTNLYCSDWLPYQGGAHERQVLNPSGDKSVYSVNFYLGQKEQLKFELPLQDEYKLMRLDPDEPDFEARLAALFGGAGEVGDRVQYYRNCIRDMRDANLPVGQPVIRADDFFPEKSWRVLAATGYIGTDPYTGLPGVKRIDDDRWEVTTQLSTRRANMKVTFTFRFLEKFEQQRLVFSPLLERFIAGEEYRNRAVKVSDSGRIRNELQTLCSQALEYDRDTIRVHFDRIDDQVMLPAKKDAIRKILEWYRDRHPVWFDWLEIA